MMAGFGSLGLPPNPVSSWVAPRRNQLMGFAAGMLNGGPGAAFSGSMTGSALDMATAEREEQQAKEQEQTNLTRQWLEQQGYRDLVGLVDAGQANLAFQEAIRRSQPQQPGDNLMSVGGHLYDKASGAWISPPETA